MQWLLTGADGRNLHRLGEWAGMYPPLPPRTGHVENLFVFANVRKRGVATQFEYALCHEAPQLGLAQLVTHIHDSVSVSAGPAHGVGALETPRRG
jgi:hypothetical protein